MGENDDIEQGGAPTTPDGDNIENESGQGAGNGSVEDVTDEADGDADLPGVTASGAE